MNVFPLRVALAGMVGLQLIAPMLGAQSTTTPATESTSAEHLQMLEQRVDNLTEALAGAERQLDEDHRKMQAIQAELEELRKTLTSSMVDSAERVNTNATAQLQQAVTQIREEQEVLASEVQQHEQTKLESASKFLVRLHGLVLFNAFVNEGVVDQPDLPTAALLRIVGQSHGSVGAGLRQTMLNFEGIGPSLWSGRLSADVSLDFFGGVTVGTLSAPAGLVRMRTAGITWEWPNDLLRAGYDSPLISPLSPDSLADIAQPSLAWSGNLWVWAPQLRWEHRFTFVEQRQAGFEFGLYDPAYNTLNTIEAYRSVTPGEAARQPGYETRLSYRAGKPPGNLQLGASGYYDRENYGNGQTIDAWAGATDWRLPITSHGQWSGEFYRGRGIGSLGGGAYRDTYTFTNPQTGNPSISGLDSIGGWTQWQWSFKQTMQLNAVAGQDTGYAGELREIMPQGANALDYYTRNRSLMTNFFFRPWSSIVFSPEFRRLTSWPISGRANWANVYTVSAGYQF
ncbi:MAG: hypothetical protein ABSE51_00620 [Terracidiphilus sp.]|jgi:hypothetical protein